MSPGADILAAIGAAPALQRRTGFPLASIIEEPGAAVGGGLALIPAIALTARIPPPVRPTTGPCNDSFGTAVGLPLWMTLAAIALAVAVVAGVITLLVRADRHGP